MFYGGELNQMKFQQFFTSWSTILMQFYKFKSRYYVTRVGDGVRVYGLKWLLSD
jgi:hypothetical protein